MFSILWNICFPGDSAAAASQKYQMFLTATKKYTTVTVINYQGLPVSESCLKKGKISCYAWSAAQGNKVLPQAPGVGVAGNPAARYCQAHNALSRILLDANKREYDFCVFEDGSVIDAWSLYYKHYGEKK